MQEKINILTNAINTKTTISFEYRKEGKINWVRIWNPHAIYNFKSKDLKESIKVHIVQVSWVSDSKDGNSFPDFRQFDLDNIENIILLKGNSPFQVDDRYNPNWEWYSNYIAKI